MTIWAALALLVTCSHSSAMGANMEVKYVLPSPKTIFVSSAKSPKFSPWVLAQTTHNDNHLRSPPLPSQEACPPQTCLAPPLSSPTKIGNVPSAFKTDCQAQGGEDGGEMEAEEVHNGDALRHSPRSSAFVRIVIDHGRGLAGVHESAESVLAERRIWSTIWTSSSTAPWRSCWILIMEVEQRMTIALFLLKLPIDPLKQIWTMANQSVEHACTPQKIHPKISHIIKGFPLGQYLVDF